MQVAWLEDQQPLLSVFVADGAGSVSQGGEGAMLAVNEAMAYMSQKVQGGELGLNDVLATDIVLTIRQRLFAEAEAKELAVRDFACTFLGLISSANGTLIMQIGDGGVVVDLGHGLQLPLTPMVGEYANMTHFITDDDAVSRLETYTSTERAHKVAAFTDGIQRLALNILLLSFFHSAVCQVFPWERGRKFFSWQGCRESCAAYSASGQCSDRRRSA